MKARHIKRLRKRIATFKTYRIRRTAGLFGDFFGYNRLGLVMDNFNVTADSHEVALKRFFRKYERMFKRKHDAEYMKVWHKLLDKELEYYRISRECCTWRRNFYIVTSILFVTILMLVVP